MPPRASAVAVGLAVLAVAQAAAGLLVPPSLPGGAALDVLPTGYSYGSRDGTEVLLGFQLRNSGSVPLRVLGAGSDLPGLPLVDVVAAGEPLGFRSRGEGPGPLPPFDLPPGQVVVITVVHLLTACSAVPADVRLLPVQVRSGRASGTLAVAPPTLPSDDAQAGSDGQDPWQQVLVRDLCG